MINWFKKPYFFISSVKFNLSLSFIIGSFIFLFLYIFKPFGMYTLQNQSFMYSFGYGLISFFTQILMFVLVPKVFKNVFNDENWTVGKNILFLFTLVTFISIFNWIYNNNVQIVDSNSHLLSFTEMIIYTFTLAIFPLFIFMYASEKINSDKRKKTSKEIMEFKKTKELKIEIETINIKGNNKEENISFVLDDLVYISSEGNYASFFIKSNNGIKERVLRNTLSNINKDLKDYKNIIRCHKSYIINSNYMDSISGNARGYFLESQTIPQQIPVSRKFKKENLKNLLN